MLDLLTPALNQAREGWSEGGIPIGAAIFHQGTLVAAGRNQRVQEGSVVLHAEMDALEKAGRRPAEFYRAATMVTTLSPCPMCSGAIILYGIPQVVIGENASFAGAEDWLRSRGVDVVVLDSAECKDLMRRLIQERPALWSEDIGEVCGDTMRS